MLRYKTKTRPGLVTLYDIRPGNRMGQFLQPRSLHRAVKCKCKAVQLHISFILVRIICLMSGSICFMLLIYFFFLMPGLATFTHVVLTMVKTPVKTGLGKTPKTHELGKIGQN